MQIEYLYQLIDELEPFQVLYDEMGTAQEMVNSLSKTIKTELGEEVTQDLLEIPLSTTRTTISLSDLTQIDAEKFIKNQVSEAFKRLGITDKINICDNPIADIIQKIAQIIEDLTQTLQDVIAAIAALLSFLNIPENIKAFLAAIMAQFYCNFKTMRQVSVNTLPDLIGQLELGEEEKDVATNPNDASPSTILQRLINLRSDLIDVVSQSQADLNENIYGRYKDEAAQLNAIITRVESKLSNSNAFRSSKRLRRFLSRLSDLNKRTLVNMPPLKEVKPGGKDYTVNKDNTYSQSVDLIDSLTNTTVTGLVNNNSNIDTTSRVCYQDLRKIISDLSNLVNQALRLIDESDEDETPQNNEDDNNDNEDDDDDD